MRRSFPIVMFLFGFMLCVIMWRAITEARRADAAEERAARAELRIREACALAASLAIATQGATSPEIQALLAARDAAYAPLCGDAR